MGDMTTREFIYATARDLAALLSVALFFVAVAHWAPWLAGA